MAILSIDNGHALLFPEMRIAFTAYSGLKIFLILQYCKRSIYRALCIVAFAFTFPPRLRHISCSGFTETIAHFLFDKKMAILLKYLGVIHYIGFFPLASPLAISEI